jgi:phage-related protein
VRLIVDFRVEGKASMDPDTLIRDVEEILAKLDEMHDSVSRLDVALDRLSHKDIAVELQIAGQEQLDRLELVLDKMEAPHTLGVDVNVDGEDKLAVLDAALDDLDKRAKDISLKVSVDGALKSVADLEAVDKELNQKQKDLDKTSKSLDGFKFSWGMLLPVLTAAVPILFSAGAGIIALAGAAAVMAPGLLGVALAAGPAIQALSTLTKGMSAASQAALDSASSYDQIYNILNKNSAAFKKMSGDMQALAVGWVQLKNAYTGFQKAVDPAVLPMLQQGFELLRTVLSGLPALVNPAAAALQSMILDFETRLKDPVFQSFFQDAKKYMYQFVTDWGTGILNIIEGITALLHAFMPVSVDISDGFLRMTESFDKWAQSVGKTKGFQDFIAYVRKEGPVVLNTLGQLVILLAKVAGALTGMGGGALGIIDKILQSINHFADANPGLFKLIVNFGLLAFAASKFIPLIAPLVEFLSTPVGAVVGAVVALAVGFDYLYTHSKAFHDWVNANLLPMWDKIVNAGKGFVTWAKGLWPDIMKIWQEYGPQIMAIVKNIWDFIGNVIQGAIKVIEGIIDVFLGLLTGNWSKVWKGLGQILSGAWQIIWSLVKDGVKVIVDVLQAAGKFLIGLFRDDWNKMTDAVNSSLERLKNDVLGAYHWVVNLLSGWRTDIMNAVTNAWNAVNNYFSGIPGRLLNALGNLSGLLWNAGQQILQGLLGGLESMWNSVSGFFSNLTSAITSWKGPPSRDAVLLHDNGALIMKGLIAGLDSQTGALQNHLGKVTKTIAGAFGDQYTADISAQISSRMSNGNFSVNGHGAPASSNMSRSSSVTFANGAIQVNAPTTPESPSQTLSRTMQAVAKFGLVQAPLGVSVER